LNTSFENKCMLCKWGVKHTFGQHMDDVRLGYKEVKYFIRSPVSTKDGDMVEGSLRPS